MIGLRARGVLYQPCKMTPVPSYFPSRSDFNIGLSHMMRCAGSLVTTKIISFPCSSFGIKSIEIRALPRDITRNVCGCAEATKDCFGFRIVIRLALCVLCLVEVCIVAPVSALPHAFSINATYISVKQVHAG